MKGSRIQQALPARERGIALVISLILLLVMTLLGVSSMGSSIMQERMHASYRAQATALSDAEAVVSTGEKAIEDLITTAVIPLMGYHDISAGIVEPLDVQSWNLDSVTTPDGDEYIIEHLGRRDLPGESITVSAPIAGSAVSVFRISALSEQDRGARRLVQTIYITLDAPP